MSQSESIPLLESLSNFLGSQKAVVDGLIILEKVCYVPTVCRATKEDWDILMQAHKRWMEDGAEFSRVVQKYAEVVRASYRDEFLTGFYRALILTERLDLLEEYPEVERFAAVIEAEQIARKEQLSEDPEDTGDTSP